MRIAHITDCYLPRLGGIEMHVHDLANRQRDAGHAVRVITSTRPDLTDPREGSPELADNVEVLRLASGVQLPAARSVLAANLARKVFSPGDFDVVHAHLSLVSPLAITAARAAAIRDIPTVITIHSLLNGLGPIPVLVAKTLAAAKWPILWSGVSEAAASPLRRTLGPDAAVTVLSNGIDPAEWRVKPVARGDGTIVVASVMRLESRKRPMALVRMLRRLRRVVPRRIPLRALVIGEGSQRGPMERYLAHYGMGWVELTGRLEREKIRATYAETDLYVAPATLESFGIAALEARCAGIPVVAFRRGGVGEFIGHGHEGLLASDDRELVKAMARLVSDDRLRDTMSAHNRSQLPSVNWPTVLRRTEAAYNEAAELIARSRPGAAFASDLSG